MPGPDLRLTIEEVARELAGLDYAAAQRALQSVYRLAWLNLMQEVERAMRSGAKPVAQVSRLLSSVTQTIRAADRGRRPGCPLHPRGLLGRDEAG